MTVLITGGTGLIGSNLGRELIRRGEEVVLFDIQINRDAIRNIKNKVKVVRGDLSSWSDVLGAVNDHKVKSIYHLGAILSESEDTPIAAYRVNQIGTFYVLEAARLFKVKKVIFTSSMATFGIGVPDIVPNDAPQRPITIYGVTKVASELLGEYYHRRFGVDFRALRFPSIVGPGRSRGSVSIYASLIFEEPAKGNAYEVYVDEGTCIPILYIKDAIRALIKLHDARASRLKRLVYNIGGISPTAGEIAEAVRKHIPEAQITFSPNKDIEKIISSWPRMLDESCALEEWGWRADYNLDKIVRDFIRQVRKISKALPTGRTDGDSY